MKPRKPRETGALEKIPPSDLSSSPPAQADPLASPAAPPDRGPLLVPTAPVLASNSLRNLTGRTRLLWTGFATNEDR